MRPDHSRSTRFWPTSARSCHHNSLSIIGHCQQPVSHPPAPLNGSLKVGGVQAGARESPGQPLALPPPPGALSLTRPPCGRPGPARLPAYGTHRGSSEGRKRRKQEDGINRRIWRMRRIWKTWGKSCAHTLSIARLLQFYRVACLFGPHNSPLDVACGVLSRWRPIATLPVGAAVALIGTISQGR